MKLTIKQKRFADEYIISGNAYQSAIKAGYSENYAKGNVIKLLENVSVKKYIEDQLEKIKASKFLTMEEALQITASIARGEPRKVKKTIGLEDGNPQVVEVVESPSYNDTQKALEHYYKINSAFTEKQEIEIKPIVIKGAENLED